MLASHSYYWMDSSIALTTFTHGSAELINTATSEKNSGAAIRTQGHWVFRSLSASATFVQCAPLKVSLCIQAQNGRIIILNFFSEQQLKLSPLQQGVKFQFYSSSDMITSEIAIFFKCRFKLMHFQLCHPRHGLKLRTRQFRRVFDQWPQPMSATQEPHQWDS